MRVALPDARAIIKTSTYLAILTDTGYPFLAREYLAAAHLCRMTERYAEAGWHALRAAWKCEDMLHPMAGFCRTSALQAFELALQHEQSIGANAFESALIIGDVWRRNGDNAVAGRFCQQAQLMAEHASQRVVAQQLSDAIAASHRGRIQRAVITN